jgi:hypothetical protein
VRPAPENHQIVVRGHARVQSASARLQIKSMYNFSINSMKKIKTYNEQLRRVVLGEGWEECPGARGHVQSVQFVRGLGARALVAAEHVDGVRGRVVHGRVSEYAW